MKHYLTLHARAALHSLGQLFEKRFSTLFNSVVIAIALTLPAVFYLAVHNLSDISKHLGDSNQLTVFLDTDINLKQARQLARQINKRRDIANVEVISKQQGLDELAQYSGYADTIIALKENPLPIVLDVQPIKRINSADELDAIMNELRTIKEIDLVQLDLMVVKRLRATLDIGQTLVRIIGLLFGFAVIFIVGNTIRLELQTRHNEIEITKLMGATNRFVRRPFLYTGAWLGLFGSILACLLVIAIYSSIQSPADQLSGLYQSQFQLKFLHFSEILIIVISGMCAGIIGAWLYANSHLRRIDQLS